MTKTKIIQFLSALDCRTIRTSEGSRWIKSTCPLAPWFHEHNRNSPVFGIRAPKNESEAPYFHCHSCDIAGTLPRLVHNLHWLSGKRFAKAENILSSTPNLDAKKIRKRQRRIVKGRNNIFSIPAVFPNKPVPQEILKKYPLLTDSDDIAVNLVIEWLEKKIGISLQKISKYQLRCYSSPAGIDVGVVFPIKNNSCDQVMDLWVEILDTEELFRLNPKRSGSCIDYHAPGGWFGHQETGKPVILVEKPLDVLRLNVLGIPYALASCGRVTVKHLSQIYASVVYVAFGTNSKDCENAKYVLRNLDVPSKFYLDLKEIGLKRCREIKSSAQFRRLFDSRVKIVNDKK